MAANAGTREAHQKAADEPVDEAGAKDTQREAAVAAVTRTAQARAEKAKRAAEKIPVKLSHPLGPDNPFTGEAHEVGEEIPVSRSVARHLLSAGYLQGDPENPEDVRRVLRLGEAPPDGE